MATGFGANETWAFKGETPVQLLSPASNLTSNTSFLSLSNSSAPALAHVPNDDLLNPNPDPLIWSLAGWSAGVQPIVFDPADGYVIALGVENDTLWNYNGCLYDVQTGNCTNGVGLPGDLRLPAGRSETAAYLGDGLTFQTGASASCPSGCTSLLDGQIADLTLNASLVHTFGYPGRAPVDEAGLLNVDPTRPFDPPDSTANASTVSFSYVAPADWTVENLSEIQVSCSNRSGSVVSCNSIPWVVALSGGRTEFVWNWSAEPAVGMPVGDTWQATIPLTLEASLDGTLPLDVCDLTSCLAASDGPDGGGFTSITYAPYLVNSTAVVQSFPPAFANVLAIPPTSGATSPVVAPPSQPIVQPPTQVPVASPVPVPSPLAAPPALQAAGAGMAASALVSGLVMAGATRVAMRPMSHGVAMQLRARGRKPSTDRTRDFSF
jgi:hypothetical protein